MIQVPELWSAEKEAGMKSASFIWPVSVGAPVDYYIPKMLLDEGYARIAPMRDYETPKGLLAEMETEVFGKMGERTFNGDYLNMEDRSGEMAAYVLEKYQPNLITLHPVATDHFQYEEEREGDWLSQEAEPFLFAEKRELRKFKKSYLIVISPPSRISASYVFL